mmetsp:Transcript_8448/g.18938  ORF Transcript_8448/g.18938 Transcript_8448/m.18938 type:complete len:101 (-) Transcript_8448:1168-1470(-)
MSHRRAPKPEAQPNATNIRNLEVALFDRIEGLPSQQSPEHGYKGMAQQPRVCIGNGNQRTMGRYPKSRTPLHRGRYDDHDPAARQSDHLGSPTCGMGVPR